MVRRALLALLAGGAAFALSGHAPANLTLDLTVSAGEFRGSYAIDADFFADAEGAVPAGRSYRLIGYAQGETRQWQQIPLPYARVREVALAPLGFPGPGTVVISRVVLSSWFATETFAGARLRDAIAAAAPSITIEPDAPVPTAHGDGRGCPGEGCPRLRVRGLPAVNAVPLAARLLLGAVVAGLVLLLPAIIRSPRASAPEAAPPAVPSLSGDLPGLLLCAAISVAYFFWAFGAGPLDPTNVRWLMEPAGDRATHYLGWSFFRRSPWTFPPGAIPGYYAPLGTSIAGTDSIPLLAFLVKPFAPLLPEPFQYFGWWLLACCVLQGVFGWLLMRRVTPARSLQAGGTTLFLASPVLLARSGHLALMAHWLLLAALYLSIAEVPAGRRAARCASWAALALASALIQPYFTAMILTLLLAWIVRTAGIERTLRPGAAVAGAGLAFAAAFGGLAIGGIFGAADRTDYSWWYKLYSTNLNALVNSQGNTLVTPALATRVQSFGQYEGFQYLGAGVILLGAAAIVLAPAGGRRPRVRRADLPLLAALLLLAAYSLSNEVTLGQYTVLIYPLPAPVKALTNAFRSSARFFWPAFYALTYAILALAVRGRRPRLAVPLVGVACVLQLADVAPQRPVLRPPAAAAAEGAPLPYRGALRSTQWRGLFARNDRVVMLPPFARTYNEPEDYKDFAFLAAAGGKAITTGYVARADYERAAHATQRLERALARKGCSPRTLYVLGAAYARRPADAIDPLGRCRSALVDGYLVLEAKDAPGVTP